MAIPDPAQDRDTLVQGVRAMWIQSPTGTWSVTRECWRWDPGMARWARDVGPRDAALPSAPVVVRNTPASPQEAGRRVIWSRGCLLSFLGSGQERLFLSFFSFFVLLPEVLFSSLCKER